MEQPRKFSNDSTVTYLENWTEAQKTTERLAAAILHLENYTNLDPSHPTGGRDKGKDIVCRKENKLFIAAVSFNRDKQTFAKIKKKFSSDLNSAMKYNPNGFIYFTNQRITITERETLEKLANETIEVVLYSLETIAGILSTPKGYGVRLEYLNIEMTKTEQLSFFSMRDNEINKLSVTLKELLSVLEKNGGINSISTDKLNEFKSTLELIIGNRNSLYGYGGSMIDRLKIPLPELRQFMQELNSLLYGYGILSPVDKLKVPIDDLKEYKKVLDQININGLISPSFKLAVPVTEILSYYQTLVEIRNLRMTNSDVLNVPINELLNYNQTLNATITKLNEIKALREDMEDSKQIE